MNPYGIEHQRLRRQVARIVAAGGGVCWRCEQPIHPREPWDLGHSDAPGAKVRRLYNRPEHRACSRTSGGWKRHGVLVKAPRPTPRQPRAKAWLEFFGTE